MPEPRRVRGSRDGEVARRPRADSLPPPTARGASGPLVGSQRPGPHDAEGRARGEPGWPPGPGPGDPPRAAGLLIPAAGPGFARAAPSCDSTSCSQLPFSPRAPGGERRASGPRGLAPGARGTWLRGVAGPRFFPRPAPPARCQTWVFSGARRWEGRAAASTSLLLLAAGFVPLAGPGARTRPRGRPPPPEPSVCAVVGGCARPWEGSPE